MSMRPRKMKRLELTMLERDTDRIIEFLGRHSLIHLSAGEQEGEYGESPEDKRIDGVMESIRSSALYLGLELPEEPAEDTQLPSEDDYQGAERIRSTIQKIGEKENAAVQEKRRVEEALNEARAFENLNAPFSDLDQLSYLTLRVGRVDPKRQEELRSALGDRAVIIPLGRESENSDRILAAASRKGRFALDSELKKIEFSPISIPEGYKGVPKELLSGLEKRLEEAEASIAAISGEKEALKEQFSPLLVKLCASFLMASQVERLKSRLKVTQNVYVLSGWVPQDQLRRVVVEVEQLSEGRTALRAYNPEEVPEVADGREKVPVSLKHGAFVRGFERVVFSYGAPLYGTIDPTPFVAFFFTILFGIMFGDLGQGLVLLLLGLLTGERGPRMLKNFRHFSTPLIAVGISSMFMGFLNGEFFANEHLLIGPTRAIGGFFMGLFGIPGEPPEHFLHLMPEKGSVAKLFYFFGFTIAVGVILNSIGLLVNIANLWTTKKYDKALFSKTGLSGLFMFWYAIALAVRIILGSSFAWFDLVCLIAPVLLIFFGPALWRLITGERPVLEEGLMVFIMEGFVEVLETASTYISNTVSFLRVGAFALSHAVLSFIVFTLSGMVSHLPAGAAFQILIMVIGNGIIIVLEGMIVAIQVVRLQYYEFFSKFFTETGIEWSPFRFRQEQKG